MGKKTVERKMVKKIVRNEERRNGRGGQVRKFAMREGRMEEEG